MSNTYGKIYDDIFDSSLMAEGSFIHTYIFMSMITLADKDGYVKHDPRTLYRKLGFNLDDRVSFKDFESAVVVLEKPDEYSNIPDHEGRRIIPLSKIDNHDGNRGWVIVNYAHYRDKGGSLELRRKSDAERKRRQREINKLEDDTQESPVTVTVGNVTDAHIDINTDIDIKSNTSKSNDLDFSHFWKLYPRKEDKKKAGKSWERITDENKRKAIKDIQTRYIGKEKKYIPIPTTYLNGERWDDENLVSNNQAQDNAFSAGVSMT